MELTFLRLCFSFIDGIMKRQAADIQNRQEEKNSEQHKRNE